MYNGYDWSPVDTTEGITLGIDYVNDLALGDTIQGITSLTCTVASDSQVTDPSPSARIIAGPSLFDTTTITFKFSAPVAGCKYLITGTVLTTPSADTLTLYSHIPGDVPL